MIVVRATRQERLRSRKNHGGSPLLYNIPMPKKILLVDDEPEILEICRDYLKASAFDVVTAKDGLQGLAAARREKPDLIVLDWMMPEMDGIDVCRVIRRESDVP